MQPKLTDVAEKAGVSVTTVSRVINNYGYLSKKTKDKVLSAMRELNYQPNALARSLHGKNTQLIGLIFPSINNPFFSELVEEIENQLFQLNYKTILCNSTDNKEKERHYLRMLLSHQVDGIIAGAHSLVVEEYQHIELPIISFDRKLSDNIPIVCSDNYSGGVLATKELYQAGARQIHFIGNPGKEGQPTQLRLLGYLEVMKEFNLVPHVHTLQIERLPSLKSLAIRTLLQNEPVDGIVCTDDLIAILAIQEAKKMHLDIPNDVKIIGFDGTTFIQTYYPLLSTIAQPIKDIASVLVNILQQKIEAPNIKQMQMQYILPVKLLSNDSSHSK